MKMEIRYFLLLLLPHISLKLFMSPVRYIGAWRRSVLPSLLQTKTGSLSNVVVKGGRKIFLPPFFRHNLRHDCFAVVAYPRHSK